MTPENLLLVIGSVAAIATFYHVYCVLDQEFPDDDQLVKEPLVYAVNPDDVGTASAKLAIDFDKFKMEKWKAFEALIAAIRFRTFYKRFQTFISPRDAKICVIVMFSLVIGVIVVAQITNANPNPNPKENINGIIGTVIAVVNVLWRAIIEHGKSLKKSVEKLRVT